MKILVKINNSERFFENIGLPIPYMAGEFYPIEIDSCKLRDKVYSQLKISDIVSTHEKDNHSFMLYGDINTGEDFLSDIRHKFKNNKDVFCWMDKHYVYLVGGASNLEWVRVRYAKLFNYDTRHEC